MRWQLTAPADTDVSCALKAVSEKHAIVGWLKRAEGVDHYDRGTRFTPFTLRV